MYSCTNVRDDKVAKLGCYFNTLCNSSSPKMKDCTTCFCECEDGSWSSGKNIGHHRGVHRRSPSVHLIQAHSDACLIAEACDLKRMGLKNPSAVGR